MFHRRRASSNPPAKAPPTAAASSAAVQAFLASRASQANLSSAAAAAALRSRPTTPTPVGDLPTRRRAQRSGSVSSNGSSRPNLQRQNSAGSMTERTFRDPSPSRLNPEYLYQDDPPPVPALPKGYASPPPLSAKSIRRPASVEPPERVISPVPRAGGRGVSLDRAPGMVQPKQPKKQKRPNLGTVGEAERTQSRESINFSRPMSPQNSPPTSPLRELKAFPGISQPYTPTPTANMGVLRDGEADNIQYAVQDSATKPVKKKKKAAAKEMVEGSHFARRGEAKPTGAPLESSKEAPVSTTSTPSPPHTKLATKEPTGAPQPGAKKKKKRIVSSESSQGSYASDSDSAMSDRSSSTDRPRSFNTRAAGLLAKQPSIVREDREAEEQEDYGKPAKQKYFKTSGVNGTALTPGSGASATANKYGKPVSQPPSLTTAIDDSKLVDMPGAPGSTVTTPAANGLSAKQPRPQSLSPGRAAHFLPQPTYETPDGIKHQPPARSVSPAKSALKHSPSSRGASPVGFAGSGHSRLSGAAGSEASDNGSVVSDDGSRLQPAKKKNARVSFDEDPVTVGHASIPPATDSPTLMSPQHKDSAKKGFLGFGRRREAGASAKDLDQDDGIKPTPALPSFGSVRGRDRNEAEPVPREVNEQGATRTPLPDTATSSDQVVGHVLSQDFASKSGAPAQAVPSQQASNDPLPPEVTSVEGSGYHSEDEESTSSEREGARDSVESTTVSPAAQQPNLYAESAVPKSSVPETLSRGDDQQAPMQNGFVPSIAILPATPGIGSNENEEEGWFSMPGGFSAFDADHEQQSMPWSEQNEVPVSSAASAAHHATDPTPASLGITEPEPESTSTSTAGSPIVGHVAEGIHHQTEVSNDDESDDTGNSIYSDAAEDISDLEGDGFGSINAIMESPVAPRTPFLASLRPESPVAQTPSTSSKTVRPKNVSRNESELSEPASEEGWDQAQAYWSGLSQSRKQQLERAAQPDDTKGSLAGNEAQPVPKQAPAARPHTDERPKKKKMVKKANQSSDPPLPPWPDREFRKEATRPASPTGGGMKQSMRSSQPEGSQAQMRSSMRNGVPLKSSLRNSVNIPETQPAARGASTKKGRPLSAVAMGDYEKGKGKPATSHGRAASVGVTPKSAVAAAPLPQKIAKPALRRAASDGSDSSSSFKKSRPSTSDGGKYSMKRTMRGAATTEDRPQSSYASKPATQGVRPSSPTSRRPFSTAGSGMRTSMRDSMDSGLGSRTKSPSRSFGFGRKTESKAAAKKTGSRFTSRFGDSSDEDEAPTKRRSRIVDSSDEEDNVGLTPVRGIPRRIDEGDSTDLEDSSASPSPAIQSKDNKSNVPATKAAGGFALATGSLRAGQADRPAEKEKKKRSFFGGLGGSKKQSQPPPINTNLPPASPSSPPTATYSSPQPPASPQSPKAARLVGSDVAASPNPSQASPKSPKLQRRNTPKRFASDSWPLPESNTMPPAAAAATMANNEKLRPSTSDGAGVGKSLAMGTLRPEPGNRRVTAEGQPVVGTNGTMGGPAIGGSGTEAKKRRFPMLRKALGLKDSGGRK